MDTKRGKPIVEDLRREINRRRAKEKEEKYNYLNNKVETRNVSNIRVKLKKMKLHDEEDKKKGVEDQGTEILYVTPSFFTPFPFFFQEVRERKREEE